MICQFVVFFFDFSRIRWRFIYRRECTLPAMYKLLMHKYHRSSKNKETEKQTKGKKVRHTNKQVTTQINKRTNKETHIVFVLTTLPRCINCYCRSIIDHHRTKKLKNKQRKKVSHTNKHVTTQINKRTNKENHIVFVLTSGHKV